MKERLTRERAKELMKGFPFNLREGSFGYKTGDGTLCGCAVTLRVLDITEDVDEAYTAIQRGREEAARARCTKFVTEAIADITEDDPAYLRGLNDGFEFRKVSGYINPSPEYLNGTADGIMIGDILDDR